MVYGLRCHFRGKYGTQEADIEKKKNRVLDRVKLREGVKVVLFI